jgi:acyl-CoA hydrolase
MSKTSQKLTPKSPNQSKIEMREMVLPQHTNALNSIFGGVLMSWIDLAAAMCAQKHCERHVVTVHIDELSFLSPIKVGEHVLIKASINYTGSTSMIIGVRVESENPLTQEIRLTTRAYLTFVAIDSLGKPISVPPLLLENEEDKRRFENAKLRSAHAKQMKETLKTKRS